MTRMGEVEGVSGHPGGSTYSRGHRSTPSQESNTLSQVFTSLSFDLVPEMYLFLAGFLYNRHLPCGRVRRCGGGFEGGEGGGGGGEEWEQHKLWGAAGEEKSWGGGEQDSLTFVKVKGKALTLATITRQGQNFTLTFHPHSLFLQLDPTKLSPENAHNNVLSSVTTSTGLQNLSQI